MTDMTNWREDAVVAFTIAKASGRSRPNVEDADLTDSILKALEDSNHIIMNRVEQISIVAMFKEVTSKRADFFSRLAVLCGHDWYDIHIRGGCLRRNDSQDHFMAGWGCASQGEVCSQRRLHEVAASAGVDTKLVAAASGKVRG